MTPVTLHPFRMAFRYSNEVFTILDGLLNNIFLYNLTIKWDNALTTVLIDLSVVPLIFSPPRSTVCWTINS